MAGVCCYLFWLCPGSVRLACVGALSRLWPLFRFIFWNSQRHGRQLSARKHARDSLWHLSCCNWVTSLPFLLSRRHSMARHWQLAGVWSISAILLWRRDGFNRHGIHDLLDAEKTHREPNIIIPAMTIPDRNMTLITCLIAPLVKYRKPSGLC